MIGPSGDLVCMTLLTRCRLCQTQDRVLSLEHVPPKSVGNAGPATVEFLSRAQPGRAVAEMDDGVALRVLCESCNHKFGSRLGTSFSEFAKQVQSSGKFESVGGSVYVLATDVFPSRIARQLLLNYLCIHIGEEPPSGDAVQAYVRSKDAPYPDEAPRLALYYNASATYRIVPTGGVSSVTDPRDPWQGAELTAPGLGVVFTLGASGTNGLMPKEPVDITDWGDYPFDRSIRVTLRLPRYRVEVPHPLAFGTRREVDRWQTKRSIIWLASTAGDDSDIAGIAAIWRTGRGKRTRRRNLVSV